jgi:CHRD domain
VLVRNSIVLSGALAIGLALVWVATGIAQRQTSTVRLVANLNADQEVPAPAGEVSGARGSFVATVTRAESGAVLSWRLTFSGLTGPAGAAHVHIAPPGQAGGVAVPLCGPCQSPATGTANVDASVLDALETGGAYANVHTAANGAGEIRGQIGVTSTVTTALNARQEVPKPKGRANRARGSFTATVTRTGADATLAWRLTFRRLTGRAVAAHIHIAPRGRAGGVAVPLCGPCRSGARGTATLNASALAALERGRAYANVHTARNPAGEIRGQVPAVALR